MKRWLLLTILLAGSQACMSQTLEFLGEHTSRLERSTHMEQYQDHLYLIGHDIGLRVMSLELPTEPVLTASIPLTFENSNQRLEEYQGYLYATTGLNDLRIYDLSDPSQPSEVQFIDVGVDSACFALANDHLYSANHTEYISIYDISNPSILVPVGEIEEPLQLDPPWRTKAFSVASNGSLLAVAWIYAYYQVSEVYFYDLSNPSEPVVVGTWSIPDQFLRMKFVNDRLWVHCTSHESGRYTTFLHLENPSSPVEMGTQAIPLPNQLIVDGDVVYACLLDSLTAYSLDDHTYGEVVSLQGDRDGAHYSGVIAGGKLYSSVEGEGVAVKDLSQFPEVQTDTIVYRGPRWWQIAMNERQLCLVTDLDQQWQGETWPASIGAVLNLTNPDNAGFRHYAPEISEEGDILYLPDCGFIDQLLYVNPLYSTPYLYSLEDPTTPTPAARWETPYDAIRVVGNRGIAALRENEELVLHLLDLSDPLQPILLDEVSFETEEAEALFLTLTRIFHEFKVRQMRGAKDEAVLPYCESFGTKQMTCLGPPEG